MSLQATPPAGQGPYEYSGGKFSLIAIQLLSEDLSEAGYQKASSELQSVIFWERSQSNDATEKYPFVVEVSPFQRSTVDIYVPSIPDLLGLMATLQPLMALEAADISAEQLEVSRKLFRALHGHDVGGVCNTCDPDEVARLSEFRRRKNTMQLKVKGEAS